MKQWYSQTINDKNGIDNSFVSWHDDLPDMMQTCRSSTHTRKHWVQL